MLRVHAKGRAGGRRRKFARFQPCNAWRLPEGLPAPSLKAVKEKMGGKKPACFSVCKREIKKTQEPLALAFFIALFCGEKCAVGERTLRVPGSRLSPRSFLGADASLPQISIIGRFASCAPCRKGTPPFHSRWRSRRNRGNSIFSLCMNRIPRR